MAKRNKISSAALDITKTSMILGVGGAVTTGMGGGYGGGISTFASTMPLVSVTAGGGIMMGMLDSLSKTKTRKRRRR